MPQKKFSRTCQMEEKTARVMGREKATKNIRVNSRHYLDISSGARLLEASNFIFKPSAGPEDRGPAVSTQVQARRRDALT